MFYFTIIIIKIIIFFIVFVFGTLILIRSFTQHITSASHYLVKQKVSVATNDTELK